MRKCRFCAQEIQDAATVCPHCGQDLIPGRVPLVVAPAARTSEDAQREYLATVDAAIARVSVVDIQMPFGSMVNFMIKWALAAIPALIILGGLGFFLGVVFGILFGGFD